MGASFSAPITFLSGDVPMIASASTALEPGLAEEPAERLASRRLPPSERDFGIYEMTTVEGSPTRGIAMCYKLSQTRVMQINREVTEWMARTLPATPQLTVAQRLAVARDIAHRRLDFMYTQAINAFERSIGAATTHRVSIPADGETSVTRECHGDPRYLTLASRLALRQLQAEEASCAADEKRERGGQAREQNTREQNTGEQNIEDGSQGWDGGQESTDDMHDRQVDASHSPEDERQEDAPCTPANPLVEDCSARSTADRSGKLPVPERLAANGDEHTLSAKQRRRRHDFLSAAEGPFGTCSDEAPRSMTPASRSRPQRLTAVEI
jgi:hypothetical protein